MYYTGLPVLLPGPYNATADFLCSEEVLRVELMVLTLQQHAVERKELFLK